MAPKKDSKAQSITYPVTGHSLFCKWARRRDLPASRAGIWARPCRRTRSDCARSAPPAARTPDGKAVGQMGDKKGVLWSDVRIM